MFGLEPNELGLVVFLAVLITASGWLPRLGEWIGELVARPAKRSSQPGQERPSRPSRRPKAGSTDEDAPRSPPSPG